MAKKEDLMAEKRAKKKQAALDRISECGQYSEAEKQIILDINELVMDVDGTAEGWGGYDFQPVDYIDNSVQIFDLTKRFFFNPSPTLETPQNTGGNAGEGVGE